MFSTPCDADSGLLRWNGFLIDKKGENRVSLMKINRKVF